MIAGYVRLSRDDDKRNYVSIENQKLIINQYASSHNMVINRWYEDDGISGYIFNRPAFNQLMDDLDKDVDAVMVKDLSRIGRHNARVLLLLDEFLERGKRLIVIDDNYDSFHPDDDVIGIKTWYNERYVKDASKKIKRALEARQKEGTILTHVPFGYIRNKQDKSVIEIAPKEANNVKMIYELYLHGFGYRKIAIYLSEEGIPTPSMVKRGERFSIGKADYRKVTTEWSDGMVKSILNNDFYIGTYRLHKRARKTVHGKDKRIPKNEQYIFENHHPSIIDSLTYNMVQEIKQKRMKSNYRGSKGQCTETEIPNPFGSCLFCKDCGRRLTPIVRKTTNSLKRYFICSTYNTKGKRHCPKSHLINETDLAYDIMNYIRLCRNALYKNIANYEMIESKFEKESIKERIKSLEESIKNQKKQLYTLITQKVKDISNHPDNENVIIESYESIQNDILTHIQTLKKQINEINERNNIDDEKDKLKTSLEVVDQVIGNGVFDRRDIEVLIERITIDENGSPYIRLKYGLSNIVLFDPIDELNRRENDILITLLTLLLEDKRNFTSVNYLSTKLTELGYEKSQKTILPYVNLLIEQGYLSSTDNPLKPYNVIISKKELALKIKHIQNTRHVQGTNHMLDETMNNSLHSAKPIRWYARDDI